MTTAVLGAGILGTLTALHLAQAGSEIDMIDARTDVWSGATAAGEGKVHLGYVYSRASDDTLALLLDSAARFAVDFEAAVGGPIPWADIVSSPFEYLVARSSALTDSQFEEHAGRVAALARQMGLRPDRYLAGTSPSMTVRRVGESDRGVTFLTPERSIDVPKLRAQLRSALEATPTIRRRGDVRVVDVESTPRGWMLHTRSAGMHDRIGPYAVVVNSTWESAAALDHLAGHVADAAPNMRLRAFLGGWSDSRSQAVTVVHGPYGDYVRFNDRRAYASWYPTGLLGFVESRDLPEEWTAMQADTLDHPEIAASMIDGLASYVPEVRQLRDVTLQARVVVAAGSVDIDDPASGLHERSTAGVHVHDGWVSVRSPKLTTAPAVARRIAEVVSAS